MPVEVAVASEDNVHVVEVTGTSGAWTLYDEQDWDAWREPESCRSG